MTWTLRPGNIAAAMTVVTPEGREIFYAYMAEGKAPESHDRHAPAFADLPLEVRAGINKHFFAVFSLPVERRGEHMKNCIPWTVEVAQ